MLFSERTTRLPGQILTALAVFALAAPGSLLPCQAPTCFGKSANVAQPTEESCGCCAGKQIDGRSPDGNPIPKDNQHKHSPCECPPGCPAPCGSGKLPTMTATALVGLVQSGPVDRVVGIAQTTHTTSAVADILRPPRA